MLTEVDQTAFGTALHSLLFDNEQKMKWGA
jgi:hypothetical protein